jgi:two-component system, NtrC family, response regulator AtoC
VSSIHENIPEEGLFGSSEAMQRFRHRALKVAATDVPVLICGESGTGKGVLAEWLHARSQQHLGPFITVNCPAIPATLLESELFGYEQGAFTGAYNSKPGLVQFAQHGTLFLDEIAELPLSLQAKLLRLLQDGTYVRVGGYEERCAEARVVCATNRRLEREIQSGTFRQDLFYRINVVDIEIPPLRERPCDIPDLVNYFMERFVAHYHSEVRSISSNLMQLLVRHNWPGNIRELENLIKQYVIIGSEETIANELLGPRMRSPIDSRTSLKSIVREATRELERKIILDALYANNWNRAKAARVLGISYRALFYKIKDSEVSPKRAPTVKVPAKAVKNGESRTGVEE